MMNADMKNSGARLGRSLLYGGALAVTGVVAMLFIIAVLLSNGVLPSSVERELVLAVLFVGGLAAGSASARRQGRGVLTAGAAAGGVLVLILGLAAILNPQGSLISAFTMKRCLAVFAGAVCGGVMSTNSKKHKKRKIK